MRKTQIFLALLVLVILTLPHSVLGKEGKGGGSEGGRSRIEVRVEDEIEEEDEVEEQQQRIRIEDQRFELRGTISSVSGNSLVIAGQTVTIDPVQVDRFRQRGLLAVGSFARVKGDVVNGTKFAREIRVFNAAQPSPTPTPTATPTPTPTATSSAVTRVRADVRLAGATTDLNSFFNQLLTFFKTFL